MKKEIELNVLGSFPEDVRYWPQSFPNKITEENKTPTLIINGKPYKYDSGINLPERSGATLRCLEPVIPNELLPRIVLKKVRVDFRSNQYSTAAAVTQFVRLYPQYGAAYGSFMGTATGHIEDHLDPPPEYRETRFRGHDAYHNGIIFDISVLPYLGNDLAFLIEAKQLSASEAESIATKIILEFQRIKKQFPDFLHGNITAFNIIVSEDKQGIFFIDSQPGYARVNNDLFQIVGICTKMMGGELPETVVALLSHTEPPSLVLDNKKYQETKPADVKTWQPKKFKFGARIRLEKLALEIDKAIDKVAAAPWDDISGNFSLDAFNIRVAVLKQVKEKIDYLKENAVIIQNWAKITILPIPEFESNPQVISFFSRYNDSIEEVFQEVTENITEIYINNKIAFDYGEFKTLVTDLTAIESLPFFENFRSDFREKIALVLKRIGFIQAALDEEKKSNKNSSSSTQVIVPAPARWKSFLDNFFPVKGKKVEDKKNKTQFQIVPFAPQMPFTLNEVIFNFLSWKQMLQLRETSHRFRSCIDRTPLPCTIIFLPHLQLILDLREAKEVQRLPPIVSQGILATKCSQLNQHVEDYSSVYSDGKLDLWERSRTLRIFSILHSRIINRALENAKASGEEVKSTKPECSRL